MKRRWGLNVFLLFPLIGCCAVSVGRFYFYPRIGLITDFHQITDGLQISGTNYVFEYSENQIYLANSITREKNEVFEAYKRLPLYYHVMKHVEQHYLIMYYKTEGSSGALNYEIYKLEADSLQVLDSVAGCTYPRLVENRLQFELEINCDLYGLFPSANAHYSYIDLECCR
jgi:hypothetical protein